MNSKQFALGGFKNYRDDELLVKGATILRAMTTNIFFSTPKPSLAEIRVLLEDYQDKLALARRKGSPQDTANKNASRKVLGLALHQLAFYVTQEAKGDLSVLLSSGFSLSATPHSGNIPEIVRGILLRDGRQSGQIRLDYQKQNGVAIYEYRYGLETASESLVLWEEILSTTSSKNNILAALKPLQYYQVQVRAVNTYGKSEWSQSVRHAVR